MKYKIEDLLEKVIDNRGKTPPTSTTGHMLLEINSLTGDNKYPNYGAVQKIVSKETYNTWFRSGHPQIGDILIPTVGTLDALAYLNRDDCCIAQNVIAFRTKKEICDGNFLYYLLRDRRTRARLLNLNIGGVQPSIKVPHLKQLEVEIPDLETQKKIVRILSALDQKIELNNQQNNALFDSVRAIFRNKYYQKGNDCSLSDCILTEINEDWGQDEKEENTEKAYCIRGADIPDMEYGNKGNAPSRYILEKRLEKKSLSEDDIIIEISGGSPTQSTGRTAYITQEILNMYDAPLLCTNFCKAIKVKNKIFAPFIYMYLKLLYEDGVLFNWENGTTGIKNLALSSLLSNTKVQSLNDNEARRFYDQFYAIVNKISKNSAENMILIQMRDTLLPKLMSDEIDLGRITL